MVDIAFLDGGLGQEINKRSKNETHPLWSLQVMFDTPDVATGVHEDFIKAGAKVISLNTYTATPTRMDRDGSSEKFEDAHKVAIQLARSAIESSGQDTTEIQIAGCLPPLVASYKSNVSKNYENSLKEFRRIVEQQKVSVDVFLIETMSNITEARAALDAAKETTKSVYLGLTLADDLSDTLRSGESVDDALDVLIPKNPDGIMLNCSSPEVITQAMPRLAGKGVRYGGYANGFTSIDTLAPGGTVDSLTARQDLTPEAYAKFALQWVDAGATIIGGCCEVGPAHIKHLADQLTGRGHRLTNFG